MELFGKTLNELETLILNEGLPRFTARQLADWLYKKHVGSISEMTNLSVKVRQQLAQKYTIGLQKPIKAQQSADGTKKYLFQVGENKFIEAAYIPEADRATLCVSSQVGCKMACVFCITGRQGFQGQLGAGAILNQISSLPERDKLTNIVYMGMGEPFDNIDEVLKSIEILTEPYGYGYSPKRITVSTIGIIPGMQRFLNESKCHLALSLHNPFDNERRKLMPAGIKYPLADVIEVISRFNFGLQRRVSFEYIMFKGINDTPRHITGLVNLLGGMRCRVNLIKFHAWPESELQPSDNKTIEAFNAALNKNNIITTTRQSRGEDILAACGMLSTAEKK